MRDVNQGIGLRWLHNREFLGHSTGILTGALILSTDRRVLLLHLTTAAERAEQAWWILGDPGGQSPEVLCYSLFALCARLPGSNMFVLAQGASVSHSLHYRITRQACRS